MRIGEACKLIADARGDRVLVATMGAMFAFDALGVTERRLSSVPLMGGAASLGLGLAISRPEIGVVVVDGDASLLMQLGGLVTVAEARPARFVHIVMQNGAQFAGVSNLPTPGGDKVDFVAMAQGAGYASAQRVAEPGALIEALKAAMAADGPAFICVAVDPEPSQFGAERPQPEIPERQFQRMGAEAEQLGVFYATH